MGDLVRLGKRKRRNSRARNRGQHPDGNDPSGECDPNQNEGEGSGAQLHPVYRSHSAARVEILIDIRDLGTLRA